VRAGRRDDDPPSGSRRIHSRGRPIITTQAAQPAVAFDEGAIVDRVLAGDREAFRALVDREGPGVVRACHRVLADLHEAEDAAQEAFVTAYGALATWRRDGTFGAWLTRIAVRACYDVHRRGRRTVAYPLAVLVAPAGRDAALVELVERLPPRDRTIVVLHYGHGYALDEIARLLDLNYATVRSRIARARIRLFREWTEGDR